MDQLEKVEKLRQHANVSFEEAKEALEISNWDMLDAIIFLERQGKTKSPEAAPVSALTVVPGSADSGSSSSCNGAGQTGANRNHSDGWERFKAKVKELAIKSNINHLVVEHNGKVIINVPIWAAILFATAAWVVSIILTVVALFCSCKFSFVGPDDLAAMNRVAGKASEAAEEIKEKIRESSAEENAESAADSTDSEN